VHNYLIVIGGKFSDGKFSILVTFRKTGKLSTGKLPTGKFFTDI
jgi:hypothetical protein